MDYIPTQDVVIVMANGKRYGGVANLTKSGEGVAICPVSEEPFPNNFVQILRHEAGGHAFGNWPMSILSVGLSMRVRLVT